MSVIYLAARYSRRLELCGYKAELERRGHSVPARWLLGEHQVHGIETSRAIENDGPIPADLAVLFAEDDVNDVLDADVMINFSEAPRTGATRGGRHVECGIFLGMKFSAGEYVGKPLRLYVVGPLENIFHALPDIDGRFDDFDAFLSAHDSGVLAL